jgi:hypothetical protein
MSTGYVVMAILYCQLMLNLFWNAHHFSCIEKFKREVAVQGITQEFDQCRLMLHPCQLCVEQRTKQAAHGTETLTFK